MQRFTSKEPSGLGQLSLKSFLTLFSFSAKAAKEAAEKANAGASSDDVAAAARAAKKAELKALLAGMDSGTDDYVPPPGGRQVLTT